MQNSIVRIVRSSLATTGILVSIGMFSITSASSSAAHQLTPGSHTTVASEQPDTQSPAGVFGWD
ncbi:MAG: hypothetical protein ACJ74U_05095 [Jatrophihabitantaceae bacterium]